MSKGLTVIPYHSQFKSDWDSLVDRCLQSNFIFRRDYLEYHSDRFQDCSLLILDGKKIVALFPCEGKDDAVRSHGGLTFGGLLWDERIEMQMLAEIFQEVCLFLQKRGFRSLLYKAVPSIYHLQPAEADRYILFRAGATLQSSALSAAIPLRRWLGFAKGQRQNAEKAKRSGVLVQQSFEPGPFMDLLQKHLQTRYGSKPVHTEAELELLMRRFPDNISLHTAVLNEELLGGVLLYTNKTVVRTQYIGSSPSGLEIGAISLILQELIEKRRHSAEFFEFGTSHIPGPAQEIHQGLLRFKEMLGARTITFDTFSLPLENPCRGM